jgi:hypothetical protein
MTRGKFRLLMAISVVCLLSALIIHHNSMQHMGAEDFFRGMGLTVLAGSMILKAREARLQR